MNLFPITFRFILALSLAGAAGAPVKAFGQETVATDQFTADASQFLQQEIAAHIAAVETVDPPQKMVLGVPTAGDFTWGSFMRAVAAVSALSGQTNIAGRDIPPFLGKLGLIEARAGGKTFSQLGAAITLRHFGFDLATNALWQSLSSSEQDEWRALLDPGRFYDRATRKVIDLPENYFGVAARITTMDFRFGLIERSFADDVLERSAGQFLEGALYTDDELPFGRYDRYSQEYARFVYEAAGSIGRPDIQAKVDAPLKTVMQTWWALVGPDGCGYPWGRTIGAISYQDTMEVIGFLAQHPEYRPAPLPELASVYHAAWQWLQRDYQPDRHLLNMFGFGRGNYAYMTPARQWQQTTAYLFKSAESLRQLTAALKAENVTSFPAQPRLPRVARFDWFRKGDRPAGAWLVRQERLRFALPITTGPQSGIADYLAAPHALPGFSAPVQQFVPALVPHLELQDGRVLVASDCADEIVPAADGKSLRVIWRRWVAVSNSVPAVFIEPGLTTEVSWKIEGDTLTRSETITALEPVKLRRFSVIFPSTGDQVATRFEGGRRVRRFAGSEATLDFAVTSSTVPLSETLQATGNSALGKGTRGPIPLLLHLQATNITVNPQTPFQWAVSLTVMPSSR